MKIVSVLILTICFFWSPVYALAGIIQGHIADREENDIPGAAVILFGDTDKTVDPRTVMSDEKGKFHFSLGDDHRMYRLVAFSNGKTWTKKIDYRGQIEKLEIVMGKKWHETKTFDYIWNFLIYLGSFIFGLISREIVDWIRRKKIEKDIVHKLQTSVKAFLEKCFNTKDIANNLPNGEYERFYSEVYDKFIFMNQTLKKLLDYISAVETKVDMELFGRVQDSMSAVRRMENSFPFDQNKKPAMKLTFLRNHHNRDNWKPYGNEHQYFDDLLEDLKKISGVT